MLTNKGRVTKPVRKWKKWKRQTFSFTAYYLHVKYEDNPISASMGTVCKVKDFNKTEGKTVRKQRGKEPP